MEVIVAKDGDKPQSQRANIFCENAGTSRIYRNRQGSKVETISGGQAVYVGY
jgi:hypothetical protein